MILTVIGQVVDLLADLDTVVAIEVWPCHMVLFTVIFQDLSRLDAVSPLVHTSSVRSKVRVKIVMINTTDSFFCASSKFH